MEDTSITGIGGSHTNAVNAAVNDVDWFAGVADEELLYYTGVGNDLDSLWAVIGSFVPPPPRPPYLPEDGIATDGLTTCDLCSWAWRNDRHPFSFDATLEAPGELGWVLTLVIVSLLSAGIGAVVMVTLLHCRRIKSTGGRANCCAIGIDDSSTRENTSPSGGAAGASTGLAVIPDRRPLELDKLPPYHDVAPNAGHNVWSWLGSRPTVSAARVATDPLALPQHRRAINLPVENHYTHMQTDEALYAELDSQAPTYGSDLHLQMREQSTYGRTSIGQQDEYHELDAAKLHHHYGTADSPSEADTFRIRRSKNFKEPGYEMYENGMPTSLTSSNQVQHHHRHHHHHQQQQELRIGNKNGEHPSYQNTAYTGSDVELDGPTMSSAPSSAYYSDLSSNSASQHVPPSMPLTTIASTTTATITNTNLHHFNVQPSDTSQYRLAAINESSMPSDYI